VDGFAFDDFARTDELIAVGEDSMRAALPELRRKLGIMDVKDHVAQSAKVSLAKRAAAETA
jgi:hypothetical protein